MRSHPTASTTPSSTRSIRGSRTSLIPSQTVRRLEPADEQEIERYASRLYEVQNEDKTPFDYVEIDSEVERRFAKELDNNNDVKFYIKLPAWFRRRHARRAV